MSDSLIASAEVGLAGTRTVLAGRFCANAGIEIAIKDRSAKQTTPLIKRLFIAKFENTTDLGDEDFIALPRGYHDASRNFSERGRTLQLVEQMTTRGGRFRRFSHASQCHALQVRSARYPCRGTVSGVLSSAATGDFIQTSIANPGSAVKNVTKKNGAHAMPNSFGSVR